METQHPAVEELNAIFERNKTKIGKIFVKHGFEDFPVNALAAGVAFKSKPSIASELAPYVVPDEYSNLGGNDKAGRQQVAAGVLGFLGGLVTSVASVYGAKAAKDSVQSGTVYFPGQTTPAPQPPAKDEAKKIFGLTYMQLALIGGALVLLTVLLVFAVKKKKSA